MIVPYPIVPPDTGGKIRIYELADGLSQNDIHVTVVIPMSTAQVVRKDTNKRLAIEPISYPFVIPFLFTNKPFPFSYLVSFHPGFHLLLKKYLRSCDIIQFEGVSFAGLLDHIPPGKKIVYDAHNVEYDYAQSESSRKWVRDISTRRIHKLERKLTRRADRILTCSSADAERLAGLYGVAEDKFTGVPNGIHLPQSTPALSNEEIRRRFPKLLDFPQRAIFSGSDVAHNRAAVQFLIQSVAPQLEGECAFVIKGQCGNRFRAHQSENVFFDCEYGNVAPYADACTVAVNPVTQGSGTSLKVLDYLVHGLPVVATEFGMRGFDDLKRFVIVAKPERFAEALLPKHDLDPRVYATIDKYSWRSVSRSLCDTYRHLNALQNVISNPGAFCRGEKSANAPIDAITDFSPKKQARNDNA